MKLLTAPEVAEILRLRVDHVYKLSREGKIPCLQFGRSYRYREESIESWLRESERVP